MKWFASLIFLVIISNTIILALDQFPLLSLHAQFVLLVLNSIFTFIFFFEAVIKIVGLGLKDYFSDKFNVFDLLVVSASLAQLGLQLSIKENNTGTAISALRAFRLMRFFKFALKWDSLKLLINSISQTISAIGNFTIMIFLFIYVYSLLGMQFFAGELKFNGEGDVDRINGTSPRANFDSLLWAFVTVFQVLVGDGWNEVMYSCIRAVGWPSTVYFITLVVFGNIILLNLFLAIIIGNFEQASVLMKEMKFIEDQQNQHMKHSSTNLFGNTILEMNTEVNSKMFSADNKFGPTNQLSGSPRKNQKQSADTEKTLKTYSPRMKMGEGDNEVIEEEDEFNLEDEDMNADTLRQVQQRKRSVDSSYDSSYTEIDGNGQQPAQNVQERESQRPSDSFDARQFARQFRLESNQPINLSARKQEEIKESPQKTEKGSVSIQVEDTEGNELREKKFTHPHNKNRPRAYPSRSVLIGNDRNDNFLTFDSQNSPDQTRNMKLDLSKVGGTSNGDQQKETKKMPLSKFRMVKSQSTVGLGVQKLTQINRGSTKAQNAFKSLQIYKEKGRFYKIINFMKRSSLFILHKRSCLRITLIKLVVPIRSRPGKFVRNGTEGMRQEEEEHLKQILDSDASSDSDMDEYGIEFYHENEDLQNESTPQDNNGSNSTRSVTRSFRKGGQSFQTAAESQRALVLDQSQVAKQRQAKRRLTRKLSKLPEEAKTIKKIRTCQKCNCSTSSFNKIFENLVLGLIVLSSLVLILDNPRNDPNATTSLIIKLVDSIFTFLFLTEAVIKILAFGLFSSSLKNQKPYMQVGWNILDLFVVTASLIDFSVSPIINFNGTISTSQSGKSSLKSLKALRALRALRPLRMISRNEGLKLVVNALFSSLPSLFNVMVMNILFILIFAIIGINFFKGTFYSCYLAGEESSLKQAYLLRIDDKFDCQNLGGDWINSQTNFDNIYTASLTLFQLMTTEGWLKIAYQGVDARGIDKQPKVNNQQYWIFYFIFFIIIGNMFILNLFVGVVIVNFNRMKDKLCGYVNMTEEQRKWVEMQRFMIRLKLMIKRQNNHSWIRSFCQNIVNHYVFEIFIMIVILINTIFMSMRYPSMPSEYSSALENANYVFAVIFNIECIMKIIAHQKQYFENYWNIFDFIVVIATNLGIVLKLVKTGSNFSTTATIIRSFRIIRIFRLIKSSQNMKVLIDTLVHILPSLFNVGSLISLMLFIYAALGINLFATVMFQDHINSENNFQSFGMAFLVLFRCATGEQWNLIMAELANTEGYDGVPCQDNQSYESMMEETLGCGTPLSYLYFTSFIITVQMIIMNLFVAVVIEGFSSSTSENTGPVTSENYNQLVEKWADYDNNATGWISLDSLAFLIFELEYPLGRKNEYEETLKQKVEEETNSKRFQQFDYRSKYICNADKNMILPQKSALDLMIHLDLPVYDNNKVHFKDVCLKLTRDAMERVLKETDFEMINEIQKQRLDRDWSKNHSGLRKQHKVLIEKKYVLNTSMHWAGAFILKILKQFKDNNRANRDKEYISYAIKKKKYELNRKKEQEKQLKLQSEDPANYMEEEVKIHIIGPRSRVNDWPLLGHPSQLFKGCDSLNVRLNFPETKDGPKIPMKQTQRSTKFEGMRTMTQSPFNKKPKDTERSTWWQKKGSRMENWLVNQDKRKQRQKADEGLGESEGQSIEDGNADGDQNQNQIRELFQKGVVGDLMMTAEFFGGGNQSSERQSDKLIITEIKREESEEKSSSDSEEKPREDLEEENGQIEEIEDQ